MVGKSEEYVFIPTFDVDQNAKKTNPARLENTAISRCKTKITEIPHEKLANTAIPQYRKPQCPPPKSWSRAKKNSGTRAEN